MGDNETEAISAKIFETAVVECNGDLQPGKITIANNRLMVDCGDGRIEILSIQAAGKKRMPVADFLRGSRFESPYCK